MTEVVVAPSALESIKLIGSKSERSEVRRALVNLGVEPRIGIRYDPDCEAVHPPFDVSVIYAGNENERKSSELESLLQEICDRYAYCDLSLATEHCI